MKTSNFTISSGTFHPFGVSKQKGGINFALFSNHAKGVTLRLFLPQKEDPFLEVPLKKSGKIWHILIKNLPEEIEYTYRCEGPYDFKKGLLFNKEMDLIDPYAKALSSSPKWNDPKKPIRGKIVFDPTFDWEHDARPFIPPEEMIIYELHVRGFTKHFSSSVKHPGLFLGIMEKIPHLKKLGVNVIELMPIHEFYEWENPLINPKTNEHLCNFWGYSTANFFTPMNRYGTSKELKELVKAIHREGMEVILDVVYNHTSEGNAINTYHSFRGIDNDSYYITDEHGYHNYSGCGNTFKCQHPYVQELILDSLRHFVLEYHVDGFRFDLASILCRDEKGHPMDTPPLIDRITKDPILAPTKMIAEPWDPGGLYQVGTFPSWKFAEWNGKFRDSVRRFIKGSESPKEFAQRFLGSPDLYRSNRKPFNSINFITIHDGFTLRDLVSYNQKHNEENGEQNRDGTNDNESWNCGAEGTTDDPATNTLRERQMRNFMITLFCAQGVPMLLMGDEYGHTRHGNNNTWGQDNDLNYFLWDELEKNQAFFSFLAKLIQFRKDHSLLHSAEFLTENEVQTTIDSPFIAFKLQELFIAFNPQGRAIEIELPPTDHSWHRIADTMLHIADDFPETPQPLNRTYQMGPYSAFIAKEMK
jgi:isoamylase